MIYLGSNLVPESLETGEVVTESTITVNEVKPAYIIALTELPSGYGGNRAGALINGVPTGIQYEACDYKGMLDAVYDLNLLAESNKIMCIFSIPAIAINGLHNLSWTDWQGNNGYLFPFIDIDFPDPSTITVFKASEYTKQITTKPTSINGYTPRNKKLLTYPYCYFGFNGTAQHLYRYEDFSTNNISFKIMCEINPNPSCLFVPLNCKNISENLSEACNLQNYPQISWTSDTFNIWMAQNSQIIRLNMEQEQFNYDMTVGKDMVNYAINATNNIARLNMGALTSDTANVLMNTYQNRVNHDYYIKQQMAQIEKQRLMPDSGTLGSSNATYLGYDKISTSLFFKFGIKPQFAEKIDKYFDLYGYATNQVKVPNLMNRSNWNYVKTIGANIMGDIPQADLNSIKSLFDNGITLWHTTSYYLDYSQANN